MRIAVTSQNFRTVTGHAGHARRFLIFEGNKAELPTEIGILDLDAQMVIHGFDKNASHPLDTMGVLITGSAGAGFIRHQAERGVQVVTTSESNPRVAVAAFLCDRTTPATDGCNYKHELGHKCE